MSKPVVLLGDLGSDHQGFPPTPVLAGSPDVLIDGKPVARVGDPLAPHSKPKHPPHPRAIAAGSGTVLVNGIPAAVTGSAITCGGVAIGTGSVVIGDSHTPAAFSGASSALKGPDRALMEIGTSGEKQVSSESARWSERKTGAVDVPGFASKLQVTGSSEQTDGFRGGQLEGAATSKSGASTDDELFERAIRALEAEVANIGAHATVDGQTRQAYARQIGEMAEELRAQARSGHISWKQAAEQAEEARNLIMDIIRNRSTPVGRALAQQIKSEGKTLNELVGRKTRQLFGSNASFPFLDSSQKQAVYGAIVESAGKSNPKVSATMKRLSHAGKGLIILSLGLSVYRIAVADDRVEAAAEEAAITSAGVGGGIAGGAIAGLACGPGAPICVGVGAFVGGGLAAFGVSVFW
ncbi:type VI secretion system PAAR protein [Marinobacter salexigens]|uniref:type VI secretion system PAAR protein n=1 Tax=Marinobacter salexigens TaxID=1925763 RepID=UPI001EFE23C5|nr:type VI secretion system PAAR protein [Marinobacter salexigens]